MLDLAARMGEGSERPIAEAIESLARVLGGDTAAETSLEAALDRVREADAKAMLSTLLNLAAEDDLARGHLERARTRAREALAASRAVERSNQVAIARAILARLALRGSDRAGAEALIASMRPELATPLALSAYARRAVEAAVRAWEASSPSRAPNAGRHHVG
jgi:hypothetical protein